MTASHLPGELIYYFLKLPLFLRRISDMSFSGLADIVTCCPVGPKVRSYREAIGRACGRYDFLSGHDARTLADLYTVVSAVREADCFLYPFLSDRTVHRFNAFSGLEEMSECYERGPALVLYAHTGSYYEVIAATSELGYRVHPIAFSIDPLTMDRPLRWLLGLNMKLSERHFAGGRYLYANTPDFPKHLRKILAARERTVLYAAIDLPRSFITDRRMEADFLGGRAFFPSRLIEVFHGRKLPILTAFPLVDVAGGTVKRSVRYEKMPDGLHPDGMLQVYASRFDAFIRAAPEQLLTLIHLEGFFGQAAP